MTESYHGISTQSTPKFTKFSGLRQSFPKWKNDMGILLNSRGISLPETRASPFMTTNAFIYATTAAERVPIVVPTANQTAVGLKVGDLPLTGANL